MSDAQCRLQQLNQDMPESLLQKQQQPAPEVMGHLWPGMQSAAGQVIPTKDSCSSQKMPAVLTVWDGLRVLPAAPSFAVLGTTSHLCGFL